MAPSGDTVTSLNNNVETKTGSGRVPAAESELWQKLETFPLNRRDAVQDFSARLARENGWSRAYAQRVCSEYLRFLFLAMKAGHHVSPSEDVDQAWHLHLVYTRSYWQDLCGEVLGRPLHHEPSSGGLDDAAKFRSLYARTLESYKEWFAKEPPADIWPPVEKRFAPHEGRWVDMTSHWLLPRPRFLRKLRPLRVAYALGVAGMAGFVAGCRDVLPVLDWRGPDFLGFYGLAFVVAFMSSLLVVKVLRGRARSNIEVPEDPFEIAFVAGGGDRTVDAALGSLYSMELVQVNTNAKKETKLQRLPKAEPANLHEVEDAVLQAIPTETECTIHELRKVLKPRMAAFRQEVARKGLVYSTSQRSGLILAAALPFLLLLGVGVAKMFIGMGRKAPVEFLIFALFFTFFVAVVRLGGVRRRTPDGKAVLEQLRPVAKAMRESLKNPYELQPISGHAMPMAVALVGVSGLNIPGYHPLHEALNRQNANSSGCGSGGCGSGGSSGGCGGGGGCGGCGGGGGD